VRSDARQEVPKNAVPPESQKVGAILQARSGDQTKIVRVVEIKENTIVIDFNHPYAGKTLAYHVKVIGVKKVAE
jgi:FKBP-type peptidyl-prolyl cis-trans isomerase SlyD